VEKVEKVTGGRTKVPTEELHNVFSSPSIRMMNPMRLKRGGDRVSKRKEINSKVLEGNPEVN
jgi:hypothetical protein